ncbi:MAG: hypothetical protein KDB94_02120 [Acidobacteria bacterium]|nr:hypothetical protein [Acidobacteriota bacterium]MCB9378654.1 hypothetical protein [Holophagales bacterium]
MRRLFRLPSFPALCLVIGGLATVGCVSVPPQVQPAKPDSAPQSTDEAEKDKDGVG